MVLIFYRRYRTYICSVPLKRAISLDKSFVPSGLVVTDENENNFHNFVDPNFKPMIKDFVFDYFNSFNESAILDGYNYIIDSGYRSFEYLNMGL